MKNFIQGQLMTDLAMEAAIKVLCVEALFWFVPMTAGIYILSISKSRFQRKSYVFNEFVEIFLGVTGLFLFAISLIEIVKALILLLQIFLIN